MGAAELIQFVMDFVEYERFIVVDRVSSHDVVHRINVQDIDHFDAIEVEKNAAARAAGHVFDLVRLEGDLHGTHRRDDGNHEVETGMADRLE